MIEKMNSMCDTTKDNLKELGVPEQGIKITKIPMDPPPQPSPYVLKTFNNDLYLSEVSIKTELFMEVHESGLYCTCTPNLKTPIKEELQDIAMGKLHDVIYGRGNILFETGNSKKVMRASVCH